jgi:hypothetical protein
MIKKSVESIADGNHWERRLKENLQKVGG